MNPASVSLPTGTDKDSSFNLELFVHKEWHMSEPSIPVEKNKGGRPPAFKSVEDLQLAIDSYFERYVDSGISERGETIFSKRKVMTAAIRNEVASNG